MGREAQATLLDGSPVSLHLDSAALTVRGAQRWVLPRLQITGARADGDVLVVESAALPGGALQVRVSNAGRWAVAITTPPPGLATKLGIGADTRVAVLGDPPPEVAEALAGRVVDGLADLLVATVHRVDDVLGMVDGLVPGGPPVWVVHGKGRSTAPGADVVRTALRAAGWRDTKVSGVSDLWTATRYTWPSIRG